MARLVKREAPAEVSATEPAAACSNSSTGSFGRSLPLPERVTEADIKAIYTDGILEVRVPLGATVEATKRHGRRPERDRPSG